MIVDGDEEGVFAADQIADAAEKQSRRTAAPETRRQTPAARRCCGSLREWSG
jgi:hypothetical protein